MATDRKDIRIEMSQKEGYELVEDTDGYIAFSYPEIQTYYGGGSNGPGLLVYFMDPGHNMTGVLDIFWWNADITVEENIKAYIEAHPSNY